MKKQFEIERKFLIDKKNFFYNYKKGKNIFQGYLFISKNKHIRVRLIDNKDAYICYKKGTGLKREEIEFKIPLKEGKKLLKNSIILVKKIRTHIKKDNKIWDIDYYPEFNLLIAEIELTTENEKFNLIQGIKKEVTGSKKYSNINLGTKQALIKGDL